MAIIKRINTRKCSSCNKIILIGDAWERHSIGKARFLYCESCADQINRGLTPRAADGALPSKCQRCVAGDAPLADCCGCPEPPRR